MYCPPVLSLGYAHDPSIGLARMGNGLGLLREDQKRLGSWVVTPTKRCGISGLTVKRYGIQDGGAYAGAV